MDEPQVHVRITYRSGAQLDCFLSERPLAELLTAWGATLVGNPIDSPLRAYPIASISGIVPGRLMLDIRAIESVHVIDSGG